MTEIKAMGEAYIVWLLVLHLDHVPVRFPVWAGEAERVLVPCFQSQNWAASALFKTLCSCLCLYSVISAELPNRRGGRLSLNFKPQVHTNPVSQLTDLPWQLLVLTRPLNNLALFSLDRWRVVRWRKEAERKIWGIMQVKFLRDLVCSSL